MKVPEFLTIGIASETIRLEFCDPGYYAGETQAGDAHDDINMHVEAVEASIKRGHTRATNDSYQPVIDSWLLRNDGCAPHLLKVGKKQYFINVEVFAK